MGITETGRSGLALLIGPSGTTPGFLAIGSGSGTFNISQTGLVHEFPSTRKGFVSTDITAQKEITWTTDFDSITMSGLTLREFGVSSESSGGTLWNREEFAGVTFDGTQELQVQVRYKIT